MTTLRQNTDTHQRTHSVSAQNQTSLLSALQMRTTRQAPGDLIISSLSFYLFSYFFKVCRHNFLSEDQNTFPVLHYSANSSKCSFTVAQFVAIKGYCFLSSFAPVLSRLSFFSDFSLSCLDSFSGEQQQQKGVMSRETNMQLYN